MHFVQKQNVLSNNSSVKKMYDEWFREIPSHMARKICSFMSICVEYIYFGLICLALAINVDCPYYTLFFDIQLSLFSKSCWVKYRSSICIRSTSLHKQNAYSDICKRLKTKHANRWYYCYFCKVWYRYLKSLYFHFSLVTLISL